MVLRYQGRRHRPKGRSEGRNLRGRWPVPATVRGHTPVSRLAAECSGRPARDAFATDEAASVPSDPVTSSHLGSGHSDVVAPGGLASTRGTYSSSCSRPSKVRLLTISRATSG